MYHFQEWRRSSCQADGPVVAPSCAYRSPFWLPEGLTPASPPRSCHRVSARSSNPSAADASANGPIAKRVVIVGDLFMQETTRGTVNAVCVPFPPRTEATLVQIGNDADITQLALDCMREELHRRQISRIRQILEADILAPGLELLREVKVDA